MSKSTKYRNSSKYESSSESSSESQEYSSTEESDTDELNNKMDELSYKMNKLSNKINKQTLLLEKQSDKIDKMNKRIDRALGQYDALYEQNEKIFDKVVSTGNKKDIHMLVIIRHDDDPEAYDDDEVLHEYHVLRVMKKSYKSRLEAHREHHPNMKVIMTINYGPNSMNLWTRIKEQLSSDKKIIGSHCDFDLRKRYTEEKLIRDVTKIHNERFDEESFDD